MSRAAWGIGRNERGLAGPSPDRRRYGSGELRKEFLGGEIPAYSRDSFDSPHLEDDSDRKRGPSQAGVHAISHGRWHGPVRALDFRCSSRVSLEPTYDPRGS